MTYALGYAFVALLCSAINDFLFKSAGRQGSRPHQLTMVLSLSMLPCVLIYAFGFRTVTPSWAALWAFAGAIFLWGGLYAFSQSLKSGAVSIAAPTFRLAFVVTALLAFVFFGEHLSVGKLIGLVLATAAVWLLLGTSVGARVEISSKAIVQVLLATLCLGTAFFMFKLALRAGATPTTALLYQALGQSLAATIAALVIDRKLAVSSAALRHGILVGILQAIGFAAVMEGLALGEASILVPIIQMSFVITAIIGLVILKESVTTRKIGGLSAAMGAVVFLGLAARN